MERQDMSEKRIDINVPVLARVEGEGALDLRIENDVITNLKLRIFEPPRYFEKFLEGRSYKDVTDIVARICGICPVAYQMSAVQALESIFQFTPSQWVQDMRRLMYCGEWLQSHSLHIHMLAAPDFLGFGSVIDMARDHGDAVRRGLNLQGLGNDLIRLLGGRSVHPVSVCAGGLYHAPHEQDIDDLLTRFKQAQQDAADLIAWTAALDLAQDEQAFTSVSLRHAQIYPMNAGRLVSDNGLDIASHEFDTHFREQHMPQSTALHCLLHDEPYLVGPLARLNNNLDRLPDATRVILDSTGIAFPSRNMFHSIVARAVEIHFALHEAIRLMEAYAEPAHAFEEVSVQAGVGYGCTEAPRGILWHRYELDASGHVTTARIVPPTSQNQARIEQDIGNALSHFGLDNEDNALQLHAEKVIRNYDPCISCATHFLTLNIDRSTALTGAAWMKPVAGGNITLIAVGSPFTPDNIAWQVVEGLEDRIEHRHTNIIKLDRPGTELLRYLEHAEAIYILDAVLTDTQSDELLLIYADQLVSGKHEISSHETGLAAALQLANRLGHKLDNVRIIGIPVLQTAEGFFAAGDIEEWRNRLIARLQHG